jgi:hypothetical protein
MSEDAVATNFMNFAQRVFQLDLPFTIEGNGNAGYAVANITCFGLEDYEKAIDLAKARNLRAQSFAEGIGLIFDPS